MKKLKATRAILALPLGDPRLPLALEHGFRPFGLSTLVLTSPSLVAGQTRAEVKVIIGLIGEDGVWLHE